MFFFLNSVVYVYKLFRLATFFNHHHSYGIKILINAFLLLTFEQATNNLLPPLKLLGVILIFPPLILAKMTFQLTSNVYGYVY